MSGMYDQMVSPSDKSSKEEPKTPTKKSRRNDVMTSRHHDISNEELVSSIRRSVNQAGKEVFTGRFDEEEKEGLADVLYSLRKRGLKSSENEIVRVAIRCLFDDYNNKDDDSLLVKVLESKLA